MSTTTFDPFFNPVIPTIQGHAIVLGPDNSGLSEIGAVFTPDGQDAQPRQLVPVQEFPLGSGTYNVVDSRLEGYVGAVLWDNNAGYFATDYYPRLTGL